MVPLIEVRILVGQPEEAALSKMSAAFIVDGTLRFAYCILRSLSKRFIHYSHAHEIGFLLFMLELS